jgi:hypothetical protein
MRCSAHLRQFATNPSPSPFLLFLPLPHLLGSAADVIYDNVDVDANIIFGAQVDDKITNGEVRRVYFILLPVHSFGL